MVMAEVDWEAEARKWKRLARRHEGRWRRLVTKLDSLLDAEFDRLDELGNGKEDDG